MLDITDDIRIAESEFDFTFTRSSGPGGQNVNKVNSKATLRWNVVMSSALPESVRERFVTCCANRITKDGTFVISSQKYRDQGRNVANCLSKLRDLITASLHEPVKRKPTKPSQGAKQRRLRDKKATSDRKQSRHRPSGE